MELHPLTISRTDVSPNPRPLIVSWMGPIVGCLLPLILWLITIKFAPRHSFLAKFFTGFCFIANGLYLGIGSFDHIGDAGDLLRHSAKTWQLLAFGVVTTVTGFTFWNGLGKHFGLGKESLEIEKHLALIPIVVFVLLVSCMILIS